MPFATISLLAFVATGCPMPPTPGDAGGDTSSDITRDAIDVAVDGSDATDATDATDAAEIRIDATDVVDAMDTRDVDVDAGVVLDDASDTNDVGCASNELLCGTTCIDPSVDSHHCGACAFDCTLLPGVDPLGVHCAASACVIDACSMGRDDCDGDATTGCEVDLTGTDHCGACASVCAAPPHGTPSCQAMACGFACDAGYHACGASCLSSLDVGSCGAACTPCTAPDHATATCDGSACDFVCDAGYHRCGGECTADDAASACGATCADCESTRPVGTVAACRGGACAYDCASGRADCNSSLVDGCEVSLESDVEHCGGCGTPCSTANVAPSCVASSCERGACAPGFADCNADLRGDGCETDVRADVANCGGCGVSCGAGRRCASGTCVSLPSCRAIHAADPTAIDGVYSIDPDGLGGAVPVQTYCDMTVDGGGWTLVGQVSGMFDMSAVWLRSNVAADNLRTPDIESGVFACIDAVRLAVDDATEIRLTNSARTRWSRWPLPAGRDTTGLWNHAIGQAAIASASQNPITVTRWDGGTQSCFQNRFGILPNSIHGGGFPAAHYNAAGNTNSNDGCFAVGVQLSGAVIDGFAQNGNGFDAPRSESEWPNAVYNVPPHVSVWLR